MTDARGTFRNWLALQESRGDEVGFGARWWTQVTPGKISSPTGILRKLEQFRDDTGITPEQRDAHERALHGIRAGHLEWRDGVPAPQLAPVVPLAPASPRPSEPPTRPEYGTPPGGHPQPPYQQEQLPLAHPDATVYAGPMPQPQYPEERYDSESHPPQPVDPVLAAIDRLTDAIMVLIRQNDAILAMAGYQVHGPAAEPTPQEWATLYAMAEHHIE